MCEMFQKSFRADHEFMIDGEFELVEKRIAGAATDQELRAFVRERDAAKPLDVDASGIHFGLIDILVSEYPEAKFILPFRNVYSWMNSCVGKLYTDFAAGWFGPAGVFVNRLECLPDDTFLLADRMGYKICLEQMMKAWTGLHRHLLKLIPRSRLLVMNTENLSQSIGQIADFCGIELHSIESCHSNPGPGADFLGCFDSGRIEELVQQHCAELMSERYPGLTLASHTNREWSEAAPCAGVIRYFTLDQFCLLEPVAAAAEGS